MGISLSANQRALFAYASDVVAEHKHKPATVLSCSLAHKLLMLMVMLMVASQVRTSYNSIDLIAGVDQLLLFFSKKYTISLQPKQVLFLLWIS